MERSESPLAIDEKHANGSTSQHTASCSSPITSHSASRPQSANTPNDGGGSLIGLTSNEFNAADFFASLNSAAALAAKNYLAAASCNLPNSTTANLAALLSGAGGENLFDAAAAFGNSTPNSISASSGCGGTDSTGPTGYNNNNSYISGGTPSSGGGAIQAQPAGSLSAGGGRRANRTRFTDFQLRALQTFFDRQAYPKDDDLETLSKKLGLSPRVIVVWFQNARQKARKIFENQSNVTDAQDRFTRTPGCNFQCKRCQLVFQRYYELIQHQQKVCYINDGDAQQTDNRVKNFLKIIIFVYNINYYFSLLKKI